MRTVTTNKICWSAFENKRYKLPEGIKTLPFDQYELGDYAIDENNCTEDDVKWDYENSGIFSDLLLSSSQEWAHSFVVPQLSPEANTQSCNTWQPLNPGFLAAELTTDFDVESNDVVNFDASSDKNSSHGLTRLIMSKKKPVKLSEKNQGLKLQGV